VDTPVQAQPSTKPAKTIKLTDPIWDVRYLAFSGAIAFTLGKLGEQYPGSKEQLRKPYQVLRRPLTNALIDQHIESVHCVDGIGFTFYIVQHEKPDEEGKCYEVVYRNKYAI
jgi:hypothetical protein